MTPRRIPLACTASLVALTFGAPAQAHRARAQGSDAPPTSEAPAQGGTVAPDPDPAGATRPSEPGAGGQDAKQARAAELFDEGQRAYAQGEYRRALELFQDAQAQFPSATFHYNIATCYEALDKYEQAIDAYRAYLRSDPPDAAHVKHKIDRLEQQLAGPSPAQTSQSAAPSDSTTNAPAPTDSPSDRTAGPPGRALIATGAALMGVGLAGAAVLGAIFGARASQQSKIVDQVYDGNPDRLTVAQTEAADREGQAAQRNQVIGIAVGGALAAAGIAVLAVGLHKRKKARSQDTGVHLGLFPSRRGGGLTLSGRF